MCVCCDRFRVSGGLEEATEMAGIQIEREKRFAMLPDSLSNVSYETIIDKHEELNRWRRCRHQHVIHWMCQYIYILLLFQNIVTFFSFSNLNIHKSVNGPIEP